MFALPGRDGFKLLVYFAWLLQSIVSCLPSSTRDLFHGRMQPQFSYTCFCLSNYFRFDGNENLLMQKEHGFRIANAALNFDHMDILIYDCWWQYIKTWFGAYVVSETCSTCISVDLNKSLNWLAIGRRRSIHSTINLPAKVNAANRLSINILNEK